MISILLICVGLGAIVGVLAGLLGIGGGLLIVPVLSYLLPYYLPVTPELAMPMAIATSLSSIILTSCSSATAHFRLGHLQRDLMLWVGIGLACGAILGSYIATSIPAALLKSSFGVLVLVIAAQMLLYSRVESNHSYSANKLVGIGGITGVISALMGIGGGAILVPSLVWYRVALTTAIGCAAFGGFVIAILGSLGYIVSGFGLPDLPQWSLGYIYLPATVGIVSTSIFTAKYGAKLAQRLPTKKLKRFFAVFLIIVGLRMILG
ncbi:sulfite exporter TauE/SafE family protein [Alteromonadaceae bacterium BrNp21-10]|nr:sulfite exporter TauE/SafE family protein [Alteromonadaceae bacterium BrNp21-10]